MYNCVYLATIWLGSVHYSSYVHVKIKISHLYNFYSASYAGYAETIVFAAFWIDCFLEDFSKWLSLGMRQKWINFTVFVKLFIAN